MLRRHTLCTLREGRQGEGGIGLENGVADVVMLEKKKVTITTQGVGYVVATPLHFTIFSLYDWVLHKRKQTTLQHHLASYGIHMHAPPPPKKKTGFLKQQQQVEEQKKRTFACGQLRNAVDVKRVTSTGSLQCCNCSYFKYRIRINTTDYYCR